MIILGFYLCRSGYNRWRDCEKPTEILYKLCLLNSLEPPSYGKNSVIIGSKIFKMNNKITQTDRQSSALYVLNHWQDMPVIGYHLVPEHVETRTLYNPDIPNLHQVLSYTQTRIILIPIICSFLMKYNEKRWNSIEKNFKCDVLRH